MKIAYCYPETLPSRKARSIQVVNTCRALAGEVEQVFLYLPRGKYDAGQIFNHYHMEHPANLRVRFLRKSFGPFSSHRLYNLFLAPALKQDRPDLVFTRHVQTGEFLLGQQWPLLYEAHEIFAEKKGAADSDRISEEKVLKNAGGVIFISQGLRSALADIHTLPPRTAVVPSGAGRIASLAEKGAEPEVVNRFVYVGTTRYAWKGVGTLLEALALLPEQYTLEIAGELDRKLSSLDAVRSLIRQGRLICHGHLDPPRVFSLLKNARVAVIPNSAGDRISARFTSPLKLIEALGAAVAVVVSDLPSMREIVSEHEAVFVRPDDPASLAAGIAKVMADAVLRRSLAEKGWRRAEEFTWRNRARKIVSLAEKVLAGSPG
ncbi:MAG: glycosyltransferase [Deltaproteobacteria bacterium]|nr:glycosyltransferase [Deltaproteobacteria bacterium]